MQIIPAIYIKDGKAAVYKSGRFERMEFLPDDPYTLIESLDKMKFERIHLVDVDASQPGEKNNTGLIGSLSNITVADITVGGGIHGLDRIHSLQYAGVDYFLLGTAVVHSPEFMQELSQSETVKNDQIVISLDMLNGKLTSRGFTQEEDVDIHDMIGNCVDLGFSRFLVAEIDEERDQPASPNFALYESLVSRYPDLIFAATGWIESLDDVMRLDAYGVQAAVVGNQIYRDKALLQQVRDYNRSQGHGLD